MSNVTPVIQDDESEAVDATAAAAAAIGATDPSIVLETGQDEDAATEAVGAAAVEPEPISSSPAADPA